MNTIAASLDRLRRGQLKPDWLVVILFAIPAMVAVLDPSGFVAFMTIALKALASTSVFIAIAVGLLALLKATGAETLVAKAFEGNLTRMIVLASLIGGLAPFCSCEVIPFISSLLALGAPLPAVMAFWLSSPIMDPAQFMITAGTLGWSYAVAKAIAAVSIGLIGGFALRAVVANGAFAEPLKVAPKKSCCKAKRPFEGKPVWRFWSEPERVETFKTTARGQAIFLLRWLAFAYLLEAALIRYLPANAVASVVGGDGPLSIVIAALVGMPAYLNGSAAPPMVSGLVAQGMLPGAALAFLVAGAVSSIPAMAAVWSLVKREVFAAYLLLGVSGAIAAGLIFQAVLPRL